MKLFLKLRDSLLDFIFPPSARVHKLERLSPETMLTSLPPSNFDVNKDIIALFDYSNRDVKEIIWEVKFGGNKKLSDTLGSILYDVILEEIIERNVSERFGRALLVPMPVSNKRILERGWNQAERLTDAIILHDSGKHFQYYPEVLKKVRHTESQTRTRDKRERSHNLKGSMRVNDPSLVSGKFIILVDDVITTGSTFNEARRALIEAGAKKILCIAVSH